MLKVEIIRNQRHSNGMAGSSRQTGMAAIRIDFSCTRNENRKKASEQFTKLKRSFFIVGLKNKSKLVGMQAVTVVMRQSCKVL